MVRERELNETLRNFSDTVDGEFDIDLVLRELTERVVDTLPITGAAVTLISRGLAPRSVAASDQDAVGFGRLQTDLGEGPCTVATSTGEPVFVPDLVCDDRFPRFGPAAAAAGLAAAFSFPLLGRGIGFGTLDLYRGTPGPLDTVDAAAARTLAEVTAAYLLTAEARDQTQRLLTRLHVDAQHDALTGLPNGTLLAKRLDSTGVRARRDHSTTAVVLVELTHFDQVVDRYGRAVADQVVIATTERLSGLVGLGDTVARVSEGEFIVLTEDLEPGAAPAHHLAARLSEAFRRPLIADGVEVPVRINVRVAHTEPGEPFTEQVSGPGDTGIRHPA